MGLVVRSAPSGAVPLQGEFMLCQSLWYPRLGTSSLGSPL